MATHRAPLVTEIASESSAEIRAAYWDALALIDSGWQLRKLRFIALTGAGAIDVHTPTHRGLTITSADRHLHLELPNAHIAIRLAAAVGALGRKGGDCLSDLAWLLSDQVGSPRPRPPRRDPIPDPTLLRQPSANLRTAFWLLVTLVCDYQWRISDLGETVADGGFIAEIPADATVIYPGTCQPDGTTAAALARLIPTLDHASLAYLRHANTNPVNLAFARAKLATRS
ncbi:hypothetical protein H7I77_09925 [Mycolicibacterium novocastrense]|uniref:Uncharacterized protein n=1 Tax=Mycolicibacterium novocastrense TaxID=59813 RepID=A0AAW5SHY2_MYCNV|nr:MULTISPECIES: hypothetical protein [Mycolicibacterium]MCV7023663.1 hypothetical protein [Mycolicibacterium novocastrense]MDX1886900.1 hypothetical protein [Mycolicibacterium sp. 120270]GAT07691.1 putative uncharacterized protein [Mycolicibacterium novocastrense]